MRWTIAIALSAVIAIAAAGCGGGKKKASPPPPSSQGVPLSQRVLTASELPAVLHAQPTVTLTSTRPITGLDPLFNPKVLRRRLDAAGFRRAVVEAAPGAGKSTPTHAGTGGFSAVVQLGSAAGAAAQVTYLRGRSLSPCPQACDLKWKSFAVPGIPGASGTHRYRSVNSQYGPAFDQYYVFFSAGPYLYANTLGGPPKAISEADAVKAAQSQYRRVHG